MANHINFENSDINRLEEQIDVNNEIIRNLQSKINKINMRPIQRQLDGISSVKSMLNCVVSGSMSSGAFLYLVCKSALDCNMGTSDVKTAEILALCGVLNLANTVCYRNKLLSNVINRFSIWKKEKKIQRLSEENKTIKYIQKLYGCHSSELKDSVCTNEHMCVEEIER